MGTDRHSDIDEDLDDIYEYDDYEDDGDMDMDMDMNEDDAQDSEYEYDEDGYEADAPEYDNSAAKSTGTSDKRNRFLFYGQLSPTDRLEDGGSYYLDYKPLSMDDIKGAIDKMCSNALTIFGIPDAVMRYLLLRFRFNTDKLLEKYMDNSTQLLMNEGIILNSDENLEDRTLLDVQHEDTPIECMICCEASTETFCLQCNHKFCLSCYSRYVHEQIEMQILTIKCPESGCQLHLTGDIIQKITDKDVYDLYLSIYYDTYVICQPRVKWCPHPNCNAAVECSILETELESMVPTVQCANQHVFCFGCGEDDHQPCTCEIRKKWIKKCSDDSETAHWITANTRDCPKCGTPIEKNGGCNHMTCRSCRYEFCWVCMGTWVAHGQQYYKCNKYNEEELSKNLSAEASSRKFLGRYMFYYTRFNNHEVSAQKDKKLYEDIETRMRKVQAQFGKSWIEVQFLCTSSEVLQLCRKTLMWSYVFAFYLEQSNQQKIFEDIQAGFEMAVEDLSRLFQQNISKLSEHKIALLDKCSYCTKQRTALLEFALEELKKKTWKFRTVV